MEFSVFQYYAENDDYCFLCMQCSSETTLLPIHSSELLSNIQVNLTTPWLCLRCVEVLCSFETLKNRAQRAQSLLFNIMHRSQFQAQFEINKDYLLQELNAIKNTELHDTIPPSTQYIKDVKEENEVEVYLEHITDVQDQKPDVLAIDLKIEDDDTDSNDYEEDGSTRTGLFALLPEHNYASQVTTLTAESTTHQHQPQTGLTTHLSGSEAQIKSYNHKPAKTAHFTKSYQYRPSEQCAVYQLRPADQNTSYQQAPSIKLKASIQSQGGATVSSATPGPSVEPSRFIIRDTETHAFVHPNDNFIQKLESAVIGKKIIKKKLTEDEVLERMQLARRSEEFVNAKYKCEPCAIIFSSQWQPSHHMVLHEREKTKYTCQFCLLSYQTVKRLSNHKAKHLTVYVCLICNEESYNQSNYHNMLDHYFLQHTQTNFHCTQCGKLERKPLSLEAHMNMHRTEECPECKITVMKTKMLTHMQESHRYEFENGVPCTVCKHKFKNFVNLKEHMKNVHLKPKKKKNEAGECHICHKKYSNIKTHLREQHKRGREISDEVNNIVSCSVCKKIFTNDYRLKIHIKNIHEKQESSYKFTCEHCGKHFPWKFDMKRHIFIHHLKKNSYKCRECGKMFLRPNHRRRHQEKFHCVQTAKHVCDICGKEFSTSRVLKIHSFIHSGEKPHVCMQCGRAFRQKSALTTHTKLVHEGIKYKDMIAQRKIRAEAKVAKGRKKKRALDIEKSA